MSDVVTKLLHPQRLYARSEVVGRSSLVPAKPGIYAWYFKESPSSLIDLKSCWQWDNKWLLYIGISPKEPSKSGTTSKNNLRKRIRGHMSGNASGSTLRLSIGCLLSKALNIELRRVGHVGGSKPRLTFASKETALSNWLQQHAFVTWVTHEKPWIIEQNAVPDLYLPLNLSMNKHHPFHPVLSGARKDARKNARQLPVLEK